ncbi:hypothetical protein BJV78DRAFT_1155583 [Lactifluus subvellereus]|nr:hypothetical protein BJV78DRAFT_1155583 [Lactifluus subvellereus]
MSQPWCHMRRSFRSRAEEIVLIFDTAILYYDYVLTFPAEVDRFWRPRSHTWASTVFLTLRYVALLGHVPLFFRVFEDPCATSPIYSKSTGTSIFTYHGILMLLLHFMTAVLLVMRVYALYFRNKWVLRFVALEVAAALAVGIWAFTRMVFTKSIGTFTRERTFDLPLMTFEIGAISTHLEAVAFSGLLVVDFTVFVLFMGRSIKLWTRKEPFLHRLFIDGSARYVFRQSETALLFFKFQFINIYPLHPSQICMAAEPPLSVVMVSRLMINLRDPTLCKSTDYEETDATTRAGCVSTLVPEGVVWTMPPIQASRGIEFDPPGRQ